MQIINSSKKLTPQEAYEVTLAPNVRKMSDYKGQRIGMAYWAIYEDASRDTGAVQEILAIKTEDGDTLATNSPTFIGDFCRMVEMFQQYDAPVTAIEVVSGTSKNGREFITCRYAG